MSESGLTMVLHSAVIAAALYAGMVFGLGQTSRMAEDRSVLAGALILAYMVTFGHGAPTMASINPNLILV